MRDKLLISTAIVLASLAYASAQNLPGGEPSEKSPSGSVQGSPGGSGAQQPAPSQRTQESQRDQSAGQGSGQDNRTTGQGQSEERKGKQAQPKPKPGQRKQTTSQGQREEGKGKKQAQPKPKPDQRKQTTSQGQRKQGKGKQAQPNTEQDQTTGQGAQRQGQQGQQGSMDRRGEAQGQAQGQTRGRVELNAQQQTRIRQTIFARSDVPRLTSVNFSVQVGTVVPARVRAIPVTAELIEIRPAFRNHLFFVVRDEIVILDRRRRIVAMIPVASSRAQVGVRGSGSVETMSLSVAEIRQVQLVLIERGFALEVDGVLGPRTQQALIQFQRREGLQPTGRIDSRTIATLGVSVSSGGQGEPSTTGQGGGAQQSPSQGPAAGQRDPAMGRQQQGSQSGAAPRSGQNGKSDNGSQPSTTGQGSGSSQQPMDRGAEAPKGKSGSPPGKSGSPPAKQAPQGSAGAGGSAPMQGGQGQSK
ncbi:MAG: peptidoglycan-binding protein [Xanthobacteraceae bacterium]